METDQIFELLKPALNAGVPHESLLAYARWWQLEIYLREVVYTELKTALGAEWSNELHVDVPDRAERDAINSYMASADAEDLLSYADTSVLRKLIEKHWELFEPILPPRKRWEGTIETLLAIRHRIAHCRRLHGDDIQRLMQALRDFEAGAKAFYGSYTDTTGSLPGDRDPVAKAWVKQRHEAASRLIDHCEKNYETRFFLRYSLRPWAKPPEKEGAISGHRGAIWHAQWLTGGRELRPQELWRRLQPRTRELVLHLLVEPGGVTATFASLEPANEIANAIADLFEALIVTSRAYRHTGVDEEIREMRDSVAKLPPKVQYQGALSLFDPANPDVFTIFSA